MLLFGYVYVYLFIPETRGLTLEEVYMLLFISNSGVLQLQVDEIYRAGIKPWNSANWKPHLGDEAHENVLSGLQRKQDDEKRTSPST